MPSRPVRASRLLLLLLGLLSCSCPCSQLVCLRLLGSCALQQQLRGETLPLPSLPGHRRMPCNASAKQPWYHLVAALRLICWSYLQLS